MTDDERLRQAIDEGRGLAHVCLYCESSGCAAREIEVFVKVYGQPVRAVRALRCPLCGGRVSLHWAASAQAFNEREARAARRSVNRQRFERDARARGNADAFGIPLSAITDTLPD